MKNYSKQREEIIEVIKNMYNHPTAEEIYFLAKQKDPSISRSTIYRNLSAFLESKIIVKIPISGGSDRYEYICDKQKHGHILCEKCNKLYDFLYDFDIEKIKKNIYNQTGISFTETGVVIYGICNSCNEIHNI